MWTLEGRLSLGEALAGSGRTADAMEELSTALAGLSASPVQVPRSVERARAALAALGGG